MNKKLYKSHAGFRHPRRPRQPAVGFTPAKYCGGNFYTRPRQIAGPAMDPLWSPYGLPQAKKFGQYGKSTYLCIDLGRVNEQSTRDQVAAIFKPKKNK